MQKSSRYERRLLHFLAVVIFPTLKIAIATDATSQSATVANVGHEIPTGFKLERYANLWEHNPFTLMAPAVTLVQRSAFDKLFLTSWLKDGRRDVIFVQNSETNEVQRITAEPNEDNLRLIALHLNPSLQFVEAVICDGKEQGSVKFRLAAQSSAGQTASPAAQLTNTSAADWASNPLQAASRILPRTQVNPPNAQAPALPANTPADQSLTRRGGSATPRVQMGGGGPGRIPRGQGTEGDPAPLRQNSGQSSKS